MEDEKCWFILYYDITYMGNEGVKNGLCSMPAGNTIWLLDCE